MVIGTTYSSGDSQSITVSGDNTNIDAAGIVPPESKATVQVSGGDFTFMIPDNYIPTTGGEDEEKVSVTFKNGDEIVIVQVIEKGGTATLPAEPGKDGHTFQGWYSGDTKITGETMFTESTTVTAKWSKNPTGSGTVSSSYAITVSSSTNGSVTVSPTKASEGTTVTITVKADEGYVLNVLTVKDASGKVIDVTESSGKYTFKMPGSAVTVSATFKAEDSSLPFTDVDAGDWFYEAVQYVYENGMMNGVDNNLFAPGSNLTRGMIAQVLYNLEDQR